MQSKRLRLHVALILCVALVGLLCGSAQAQPPKTRHNTTRNGFVRDWLKLGPIPYGSDPGDPMQGHPINYDKLKKAGQTDPTWKDWIGLEWKAAPNAGDRAAGRAWTEFHPKADRIGLDDGDYQLNYLVTYLWSDREIRDAAIYCGSDDFIQLTVNGECVHVYKNERRGLLPGDEVTGVHLHKGWNLINAKVVDVTHGYEFFLCIVDETGTPMAGAPITLKRPQGLAFCTAAEAVAGKARMHDLGQEQVPPGKAYFSAAEAVGHKYPLKVEFSHEGDAAGFFKEQPVGYARAGIDKPIGVRVAVTSTDAKSAKELRLAIELLRRDQRDSRQDLSKDKVVDRQEATADLSKGAFSSKSFHIPFQPVGYYAVEVSAYDGDKRVKWVEHPFAMVADSGHTPEKFTGPLPASAKRWQPGDHARWATVALDKPDTKKLKFWPTVPFPTEEIAAPRRPNFMEHPGSGHMGLGRVSPTPGKAPKSITTVRQAWVEDTRKYTFTAGGKRYTMDYYRPRASMGALAVTDYSEITVLQGLDEVGLGPPSHIAYRSGADVRIETVRGGGASLSPQMSAPWLLMWFSGSENWKAADIPALVVLQHKPTSLQVGPGGVDLAFDGPAGAVAVMPLLGTRITTPRDTGNWASALPKDIPAECDFWASVTRKFPKSARDFVRVNGRDVECRIDYEYVETKDDWGTEQISFAPLPYWVALAAEHPQTVVELPGTVRRTRQVHPYGPVAGQTGATSAHYVLKDMTRYVDEVRVVTDAKRSGVLKRAWDDLAFTCGKQREWALCTMSDLGGRGVQKDPPRNIMFSHHRALLARDGAFRFGQHCFENENSMIVNTTHALQYLPHEQNVRLKALMMRFMENGTMLARYQAFNDKRLMFEDVQWFISRFMCGAWSYGHFTGHWQLIRDRWPLIRAEFGSISKNMDYEKMRSCGSEESNGLYQAGIGYARCARVVEDWPEYVYAMSYATRHLALQQALSMTLKHDGHQTRSWFAGGAPRVDIADATAVPKRPALFYWWYMSQPIYDPQDQRAQWHATVISPFSYPYFPEIMRFQTERNKPFIEYYLGMWRTHWPQWYKGKTGGWGVYFGAPEYFASRGWMCDYTGETAEEMMVKYLQNHWGANGPEKGRYEFNNRGWMSLPKALTAIIEASGKRRWVKHY